MSARNRLIISDLDNSVTKVKKVGQKFGKVTPLTGQHFRFPRSTTRLNWGYSPPPLYKKHNSQAFCERPPTKCHRTVIVIEVSLLHLHKLYLQLTKLASNLRTLRQPFCERHHPSILLTL
jgi:hypothetical protein